MTVRVFVCVCVSACVQDKLEKIHRNQKEWLAHCVSSIASLTYLNVYDLCVAVALHLLNRTDFSITFNKGDDKDTINRN